MRGGSEAERACPGCSSPVGRYQWVCRRCERQLVSPVVVWSLKLVVAGLLVSGPVAFLVVQGYSRSRFGWLVIAVGLIVAGWLRPRTVGVLLLVVSLAMIPVAIWAIALESFGVPEPFTVRDVLLVAFLAGVPFVAGITLLVAAFAIRPWIGGLAVLLAAAFAVYVTIEYPYADAPETSHQPLAAPGTSEVP